MGDMSPIKITLFTLAIGWLFAGCTSDSCLDDYVDTVCPPDTEPCAGANDETGAECLAFVEPDFDGAFVSCDGVVSNVEVLSDSAAHNYGVTDYAFESSAATWAGLLDFQAMPQGVGDNDDPWHSPGWWLSALPGVTTHDGFGLQWAGYFGRVCCAQHVTDGTLPALPANETCARGGLALGRVDNAWCLDLDGGTGFCVSPCSTDADCPNPAGEFCDLLLPDPNGGGPGTCRYKSMPGIPTPHEEIGN